MAAVAHYPSNGLNDGEFELVGPTCTVERVATCDGCGAGVPQAQLQSGAAGTDFEGKWYCGSCWDTWGLAFRTKTTGMRAQRVADLRASLQRSLAQRSADLQGLPPPSAGLPVQWPRLFCTGGDHVSSHSHLTLAGASDPSSHLLGMRVRALSANIRPRIFQLWREVLPKLCRGAPAGESFEGLLAAMAASETFKTFWIGPNRGPFVLPALPVVKTALSSADVVAGLAATVRGGRRKPCESALTLTDGDGFRNPIGLPPICTFEVFTQVLEYGTVFLNTASLHWKSLASACLAASRALQFPTNINVYVTSPNRRISTDVHCDNHDVFIFQSEGVKHWRVFPPPARGPGMEHPLYRGKHADKILDDELAEPLIDIVLQHGEILFVPMGFPHATATVDLGSVDLSVHLTLGISAADYDLSFLGLRRTLMDYLGHYDDKLDQQELVDEIFWELWSALPVGGLVPAHVRWAVDPAAAHIEYVAARLCHIIALAEPERFLGVDQNQLRSVAYRAVSAHLGRQLTLLESHEQGYEEVVSAAVEGPFLARGPDESTSDFRRSMLHNQELEDARKRERAQPKDPRFVRRTDPADGAQRTRPELTEMYRQRGFKPEEIDDYWDQECKPLFPDDEPPAELMDELVAASEDAAALLYFLRKRTPHLHTDCEQAPPKRDLLLLGHGATESALATASPRVAAAAVAAAGVVARRGDPSGSVAARAGPEAGPWTSAD